VNTLATMTLMMTITTIKIEGKIMKKLNRKALHEMADSSGLIYKPGRKKPILHISDDGTITRADTNLDLCRAMTVREAQMTIQG